jgi:hypothetical protein
VVHGRVASLPRDIGLGQLDGDITTPEQYQTFKEMLLRLLDDPQIQQKISAFLRNSGLARSTGINVPQRWYR